jgi:glycosyltransferase involved in cell wall biosynthesis
VPIKNLLYLLELLRQVRGAIQLTVVGPAEQADYWSRCGEVIRQLPPAITVEYAGARPAQELQGMLLQHHLFVLPTKGENFGHAIFESLLAGRPVLISDQTPWLNLQASRAGWDLPLQNPATFAAVLEQVCGMDHAAYEVYAKGAWQFAERFIRDNPNRQRYIQLFS